MINVTQKAQKFTEITMDYNNPNDNWRYDPYKGMTDNERMRIGCAQGLGTIVGVIIAMALCALLGSCTTTKYVPVIEHRTDTVRITQQQRDSIYLHDSIRVSEKGDTIRIDRWHTKYIERTTHDTIYQSRHDTIPQPYKVTEYVERKRSTMEWGLIGIGTVALLGFIVWLAVRLSRFLP
jgi:hypothetical protein